MASDPPVILVVDDDPALLQSFEFLLSVAGYRVVTGRTGEEALSRQTAERPAAALVDLKILYEDGIDVASVLKARDPLLETIIITAYPSIETAVKALKSGAFDYLTKTSETESILETLREALARRELNLARQELTGYGSGDIGLVIICHNVLVQKGLLHCMARSDRFRISAFYSNLPTFLQQASSRAFDVLLVCAACNLSSGEGAVELVRRLQPVLSRQPVVFFNADLPEDLQIELIKNGVGGFLGTDIAETEMERLLANIHRGEIQAAPPVLYRALTELSQHYSRQQPPPDALSTEGTGTLTGREKEIVRCLARGLKNKEIANQLFISEKTVKTHINNIFAKLGAENRLQAIAIAHERKLLY
jgi:DNA-binding NarL/FixJ family response regulator